MPPLYARVKFVTRQQKAHFARIIKSRDLIRMYLYYYFFSRIIITIIIIQKMSQRESKAGGELK